MRTQDNAVSRDEAGVAERALARATDPLLLGGLAPSNALALQHAAGNRAVARIAATGKRVLGRDYANTTDPKREMRETKAKDGTVNPAYKSPDIEDSKNAGALWVYDPFDYTLTIFTDTSSQAKGMALRVTFKEGTKLDIPALAAQNDLTKTEGIIHTEVLSAVRAKALKELRELAGTYQETEDGRKARMKSSAAAWKTQRENWAKAKHRDVVAGKREETDAERQAREQREADLAAYNKLLEPWEKAMEQGKFADPPDSGKAPRFAKITKCMDHVGLYAKKALGVYLGDMDPRQQAINEDRAGSFRTLQSNPFKAGELGAGPQAGDIISYGLVKKASKKDGLRIADFSQTMHVGVLKSRRAGTGSNEIWTVIDGGQGGFGEQQETQERVRRFSIEKLSTTVTGQKAVDLDCGVFKGHPSDYLLRGWIDIDAFAAGPSDALADGAAHGVFPKVAKTKNKNKKK